MCGLSRVAHIQGVTSDLVGGWTAKVTRPSGIVEIGLHFTVDGTVFLTAGAHGVGVWRIGEGGIRYHIKEAVINEQGDFAGYVDISQSGAITGGSFSTEGESRVYDADGVLLRTVPVRIAAQRK